MARVGRRRFAPDSCAFARTIWFIGFFSASQLVGAGPRTAARQAAALLALAGALAVVGAALTPDHATRLLVIAVADLGLAAVAWVLPWGRWGRYAPLAVAPPALAILAVSTWAFGGTAAGTGPFFVLVFAWFGLNFPPWVSVVAAPAGLVAYVVPLVVTDQPPDVVGSGVVLLPIAVGIALLIAHQVEHQRRDRERIAQIERWRAALTAALAHDVRSPLATVQLVLEAVRAEGDDLPAPERDRMLVMALSQVSRIGRLTASLLDVERVDASGELRLDLREVGLLRVVDAAVQHVNSPEVAVEVDPDLVIEADPDRLEQIIINLTTNALRHGRPPVVVRGGVVDGQVRIEVRDYGPGVPPGDVPQLFSPFHQGQRRHAESIGLGLWIVDRMARAHGGRVRYEQADPGARLVVTLPVVHSSAAAAERPTALRA